MCVTLLVCRTEKNQPELEIQTAVFILHSRLRLQSQKRKAWSVSLPWQCESWNLDRKRINQYGYRYIFPSYGKRNEQWKIKRKQITISKSQSYSNQTIKKIKEVLCHVHFLLTMSHTSLSIYSWQCLIQLVVRKACRGSNDSSPSCCSSWWRSLLLVLCRRFSWGLLHWCCMW